MKKKQSSLKVSLFQKIFPNYREEIFRKLGEEYSLTIFHGEDRSGIPQINNKHSTTGRLFKIYGFSYLGTTIKHFSYRPKVIIQEFSLSFANLYINFVFSKIFKIRFILWGHGYDRSRGFSPHSSFRDKILQFFIIKADAIILYSDDVAKDLAKTYTHQQFFVARNSIDSAMKNKIYEKLSQVGRLKVQRELGFSNGLNVCFVARLTKNKQPLLLCEIVKCMNAIKTDIVIHVVGDGEMLEPLKQEVLLRGQENNFKFYGPLYEEAKVARVIYASDFMVIPAWLGLSINHTLCYGTPAATLSNVPHPPEIEFAQSGINAVLGESVNELSGQMNNIWRNAVEYENLRSSARHYYEKNLSLSSMLSGFIGAVESVSTDTNAHL